MLFYLYYAGLEKIPNYIVTIKFYLLNFISYSNIYKNLYERERRGEKCQVIHKTKLRDDSVWGGIS